MLGRLNPDNRRVTVVGAGISGLLAAYRMAEAGFEVEIFEAAPVVGGLLATRKTAFGIAETAAHSILASEAVVDLCRELSLPIVAVKKNSRSRFILRENRMKRIPLSAFEMIGLIRRMAFARAPSAEAGAPSLEAWARTHLGQAGLNYLLSPILLGVYGATADLLSVDAAFPKFSVEPGKTLLGTFLSRRKARGGGGKSQGMVSLLEGMGSLTLALSLALERRFGVRVQTGRRVEELPRDRNVILSVPAPVAAALLKESFPITARGLAQVKYAPLVSCTVYVRNDLHQPGRGVGVLVPPVEKKDILGVLFNSSSFPGRVGDEKRHSSYTVMFGGTLRPELIDLGDADIRKIIEREFQTLFNLRGPVEHIEISRWKQAIPIYSPELMAIWKSSEDELSLTPGTVLFGNYTGQVSIRGMIEKSLDLAPAVAKKT